PPEVQEDTAAGIALLQVDAIALVCLHDAGALRTQQRVGGAGRRCGLRGFIWRDAHIAITLEQPGKCLGVSTMRRSLVSLTSRLVRTSEPRRLRIRNLRSGNGQQSQKPSHKGEFT